MGKKFLLTVEENSGANTFTTKHLVEAKTYQHVKYHFHRTLKDFGYHDTPYDKHCLEGYNGHLTEIHAIDPIDNFEWEVMNKYLPKWTKV